MKTKIFTLLFAIMASVGTIFAQSGTCGENLTWNLTNGVLTISGTGEMTKWSLASNVPWYSYRSRITSVIIGNSVTSIESYAFYNCSRLTNVTVPNSVTNIGGAAFSGCSGLTSIIVENGNSVYDSRNNCNAIIRTATNTLVAGCQNTTIPNSVTNIGNNAFSDCTSLTSITIPNSVTYINYNAFIGCSGLTSIEIPNSVIRIDDYAFYECSALTSITCEAITPPYCENHVFYEVNKSIPLYVPAQSVSAYQTATGWRDFANILPIQTIHYSSIADLYNMAADSTFTLGAFDVVYVPDFQNGSNMYIKDETGSMVIYKVGYGLQAGDHVEAGLQGKISIYNGICEIIPISQKSDLTVTAGEAPAPMEATEVPSLTNVSQFVVYKNVSFATDTAFVEGRRHAVNGTWNGQQVKFYNQYYIGATLSASKTYNITAVNAIYVTNPEAYPLAVEEVTTDTLEPCLIASGTCGENLTWTLTCDSVLTISGTGDMTDYNYESSLVPWKNYRNSIKSLIIENGVTRVDGVAFQHCKSLTYITIPNSVTKGLNFYACNEIISIDVESDNQNYSSIDGVLFDKSQTILMKYPSKNPRTEYSIPSSVTNVRNDAFHQSTNLISITIPNSVRNIGSFYPFANCTNLTSINVATDNPNYSSTDGVLFNKDKTSLIQYPGGKQGEYAIPNSVTSIGEGAFMGCAGLTSIEIPNSIISISSMVFDHCTSLSSVILPDGVTTIEYQAFYSCTNLISVTIPTSVTSIGNHVFSECSNLTLITNYAVEPQAVTQYMFMINWATNHLSNCTLYVPAQSIAAYQTADVWKEFGNILPIEGDEPCVVASGTCGNNLTWTLTCDSVLTISGTGDMTDWQDTYYTPWYDIRFSVKQIVIEEGVTSIGKWAFGNCVNVSSVTIPNGVTRIADWAFGGCQMETLEIPNSVLSIGKYAFYTCESLKNLTLSGNLLSIGQYAFCYCHNLTSIELPNKLTTLDEGAFRYCSGLSSVTIPNSVTSIGIRVFGSCSGLNSIIVASNNSNYSSEDGVLFNKNKTTLLQFPGAKIGSYTIPQGVINIAQEAFMGSSLLLTSIVIPSSVASIGERAFYDCVYFASITCEAVTPPTCGDEVFYEVDKSVCTLYVPAQSITAYQTATGWRDFANILPIQTIHYATIADLYNMAQDSTFTLGAFDVVYVPDFQNGSNMYIKDETGSMVIYKPNYGLQAGDHVEAGLQGKISIYHGLYEVAPVSAKEDLTVTAGDAPAPMVATEVPSATNVNQFVVYKNVSFATDTAFVESKRHAVHGTWNNQQITFYNQYYIGAMLSANKTYNITAVNTIYGTTPQAYPLAVEEVTTDTIEPCHTISGTCGTNLTWELSCDSVLTISGTGAMVDNPSWSPYVSLIKAVIMPEGLTIIGRNAFAECVNLESAHIPESVTAIGPAAFYNCSALTSINMPDSVRMLGHKAFVGCESLTEPVYNAHIFGFMPRNYCGAYSIPEGIVSVAAYAFCGIASATCSGLTEITIPSSVKRLGVEAFGLLFLRKITCLAVTPPTCDSTTFEWYLEETGITVKVDRSIPVYVPAESVDAYKAADVWKEFINILPIGGTIEPQDSIYDVVYLDQAGLQLDYEPVTLHLPEAPQIEGFTFLKWQVVAGDLENGIYIQAVYTANEPTNAPEVYTNPANKAQKLIRNGKVYILTDDKVYSISGQKVK